VRRFECDNFGVTEAVVGVEAFADSVSMVTDENRSDHGIGTCERDPTRRKRDRSIEEYGISG
jgi:hypothetical protein